MPSVLSVALLPQLLPIDWSRGQSVAIVIDTLRFTSTACVALAAGAKAITVVSEIGLAREAAAQGEAFLCGERHCVRIEGFHFGNSPAEYTVQVVQGRELVFSTTNGTVAVEAARAANRILLGSLLNRASLCDWLLHHLQTDNSHVWLVCSGTDGQVALEDVLTAGAIIDRLLGQSDDWQLANDASWLALSAWREVDAEQNSAALIERLQRGGGGQNLIEAGFQDDLHAVAQLDTLNVVPQQVAPGRFELV